MAEKVTVSTAQSFCVSEDRSKGFDAGKPRELLFRILLDFVYRSRAVPALLLPRCSMMSFGPVPRLTADA